MKKLLLLLLTFVLCFSSFVYAEDMEDVTVNDIEVKLDGGSLAEKDVSYIRDNGDSVPSSLIYKGTTYMPLKLIAQLLNIKVGWDSETFTVLLTSAKSNNIADETKVPMKSTVNYGARISIDLASNEIPRAVFIEDKNGKNLKEVKYTIEGSTLTLENTYYMTMNESYTIATVYKNEVINNEILVSNYIRGDSFEEDRWAYYLTIPANPSKGVYHPFIIRVPKVNGNGSFEKSLAAMNDTMIAEGSNEQVTSNNAESYSKVINTVSQNFSSNIGYRGNYISMLTMFPRPIQDGSLYTHSLDRDTLFRTKEYLDNLGRGNLYRLDIQFKNSIEYAQEIIAGLGKEVDKKVFLVGFSASADFATRMNYLQQDITKAVVVNASPTLPYTDYNGVKLRYPLGMADIEEVTGKGFDIEKFRTVPQYWHTGDLDNNDGTYFSDGWGDYQGEAENWNQEGIDYRSLFGEEIVERKRLISDLLAKDFPNIVYKEYKGLEHSWNNQIEEETIEFLKTNE